MIKDTKDVIRMLPINEDVKHELIAKFDTLDTGVRHDLIAMVWEAYDTLCDDKIDEKFYDKFYAMAEGKVEATPDLYNETVEEVYMEMANESEVKLSKDELSDIRTKLKAIIVTD